MTLTVEEQLCKRREKLLQELAWTELLIIRARKKQIVDGTALNDAAEFFPRVRNASLDK